MGMKTLLLPFLLLLASLAQAAQPSLSSSNAFTGINIFTNKVKVGGTATAIGASNQFEVQNSKGMVRVGTANDFGIHGTNNTFLTFSNNILRIGIDGAGPTNILAIHLGSLSTTSSNTGPWSACIEINDGGIIIKSDKITFEEGWQAGGFLTSGDHPGIRLGNDGRSGGLVYLSAQAWSLLDLVTNTSHGLAFKTPAAPVESLPGIMGYSPRWTTPANYGTEVGEPVNYGELWFFTGMPLGIGNSNYWPGSRIMGKLLTNGWQLRGKLVQELGQDTIGASPYTFDFSKQTYQNLQITTTPIVIKVGGEAMSLTNITGAGLYAAEQRRFILRSGAIAPTFVWPASWTNGVEGFQGLPSSISAGQILDLTVLSVGPGETNKLVDRVVVRTDASPQDLGLDPTNIPTLKVRYQLDLQAYANNEGITNIADNWTNKWHARGAATAANTIDGSINGRAYAAFSGTGAYVTNFPALSQTNVIFTVSRKGGSTTGYYFDSANNGSRNILLEATSTTMTTYAGGTPANFDRPSGWCIIEQQFAGANSYVKTNGVLAQSGVNIGAETMGGITIGQRFAFDNGADFDLAALHIFSGPMSSIDKSNEVFYLKTRYGITATP